MENQSNKTHRPTKVKKKHTGGESGIHERRSLADRLQTKTRKLSHLQILAVWQKLLRDLTMYVQLIGYTGLFLMRK
jgi:hypothetical protein